MVIFRLSVVLGLGATLAGCQQTPTITAAATASSPRAAPAALTEAAARATVASYVSTLPNAALYVPDSASAVEVGTRWQVQVPRTDWARHQPNKAAFEVDKATSSVITRPVK